MNDHEADERQNIQFCKRKKKSSNMYSISMLHMWPALKKHHHCEEINKNVL